MSPIRGSRSFLNPVFSAIEKGPKNLFSPVFFQNRSNFQLKGTRGFTSYRSAFSVTKKAEEFFRKPFVIGFLKGSLGFLVNTPPIGRLWLRNLPVDDQIRKEVILGVLKSEPLVMTQCLEALPIQDANIRKEIFQSQAERNALKWSLRESSLDQLIYKEIVSVLIEKGQLNLSDCRDLIDRNEVFIEEELITKVALDELLKDPWEVIKFLKENRIQKESNLNRIRKEGIKHSPFVFMTSLEGRLAIACQFFCLSLTTKSDWKKEFSWLFEKSFTPEEIQKKGLIEVLFASTKMEKDVFLDLWSEEEIKIIFEKIACYRNHSMSDFLAGIYISEANSQVFKDAFSSLACFKEMKVYMILPSILPAKWMVEAQEETPVSLVHFFQMFRKELRDVKTLLLSQFLLTAQALEMLSDLSSSRKLELLSALCDPKINQDMNAILQNLRLVLYFCKVKNISSLTNFPEELKGNFMKRILGDVQFGSIDNFLDRYEKTFGSMRVPYALELYKARVFEEIEIQETLFRFTKSVLLETFKEERYRTDINPHLQQIDSYGQGVLSKWKSLTYEKLLTSDLHEKIMLSTDWQDLFLSGTESGTCQRIDGPLSFNKCLLAYCLDGKNAMLAVKNKQGKVVERALLRLLWDPSDEKPVLFLDERYPLHCVQENAILSAAKEISQELGCTLFLYDNGCLPQKKIVSLGSSCPFEYSAKGVSNGIFELKVEPA